MARSSRYSSTRTSRKFLWLSMGIVFAIIAYSGVWYYLAGQLESRSKFLLSDLANANVSADCEDLDVRGYPFRLGLYCSGIAAQDKASLVTVKAGSFRSAAQVYRPNHIVSELDGPATLDNNVGATAQIDWALLRSSTVFGLSGLNRASMESKNLQATINPGAAQEPVQLTAAASQMHTLQNGADLETAFSLTDAQFEMKNASVSIPKFDLEADLTLANRASLLSGRPISDEQPWRDMSASINTMSIRMDSGAQLSVVGPFSIDGEGYITGKFDVEISGRQAWQKMLIEAFPDAAQNITTAANLIAAIGQKQDKLNLPLNVDRGNVRVGFIKIGNIPPF